MGKIREIDFMRFSSLCNLITKQRARVMEIWLVYTDLDGTLLDADTYSFNTAKRAISYLNYKNFPVIPCTSKTHKEVEILRKKAGLNDAFITENGSAIFYPLNYFPADPKDIVFTEIFTTRVIGKKYTEIISFYKHLINIYHIPAKGFHQMQIEEIAKITGLDINEAKTAGKRFFSEPLFSQNPLFLMKKYLNL